MKYVVLLGDGMADYPVASLGNRTPLQAAGTPNMDLLARDGRAGLAATVPDNLPPGSDVANLSVAGYDPAQCYSGRAPLEAASIGIDLSEDDIAFRCNFVTVVRNIMEDYSAGHITSDEGRELVKALKPLMPGRRLYAGVSYRNLLVLNSGEKAICTPPHDITDQPIDGYLPRGKDSELLMELMEAAKPVLENHPVNLRRISQGKRPANMIWLWGQGPKPSMPTLEQKYGIKGAMISAVDLLKGIGTYAGMEIIEVPGATGDINTNYQGKVDAALDALKRVDLVYLHIEAPDEEGHEGNLEGKIKAIELFDSKVVGPMVEGLNNSGWGWRVCVLPDHPTPVSVKTHTRDPVLFTIAGKGIEPDGVKAFDEVAVKQGGYGLVPGHSLMNLLIRA